MSPYVGRGGLAFAGLILGVIWIAAIGWLDHEAETGLTLAVAVPVHGQTLRAGGQAYLDVRAEARGLGAACVLTATDHVDSWRSQIGKTSGERELNERLGPLRGHGERIAWFDLQCPEGPSTAQPRARRVTVSTPPVQRAEIARVHVRIGRVQRWLSKKIGPVVESQVKKLRGQREDESDKSWHKIEEIEADNVRLYARSSGGLALAADLKTTILFRKLKTFWFKGRMTATGRVTVPFAITGFDRNRGWAVKIEKVRWTGRRTDMDVWCDSTHWAARTLCQAADWFDFGYFERSAKDKAEKMINKRLSCREKGCVRKIVRDRLKKGINDFTDEFLAKGGPSVAALLGNASLLGNIAGLAREMKIGLSRVKLTDRGRGLAASLSVDSAWLGAHTPELHTPRRALSNAGSLVVSFVAVNRMLAKFFDRPFCTQVAPELQELRLLGENSENCDFAAELPGGEDTLLGWTGLVLDPDFTLPLRVRPLGRTKIELYVAGARPFAPVEHTAMGVFARLERTLARRAGGTWTLSASERPGSTVRLALEAMPTGTEPVSARVRVRYDSIAQLIDLRPGAATPAWLDVAKHPDRKAIGKKIATIATFNIPERLLKLGDLQLKNPQVTLLRGLNALHASGDIATE